MNKQAEMYVREDESDFAQKLAEVLAAKEEGFEPVKEVQGQVNRIGDEEPDVNERLREEGMKALGIDFLSESRNKGGATKWLYAEFNKMPPSQVVSRILPQQLERLQQEAMQLGSAVQRRVTQAQADPKSAGSKFSTAFTKIHDALEGLDTAGVDGSLNTQRMFETLARQAQRTLIWGFRAASDQAIQYKIARVAKFQNNPEMQQEIAEQARISTYRGQGNIRWGMNMCVTLTMAWQSIADSSAPPLLEDWNVLLVKMALDDIPQTSKGDAFSKTITMEAQDALDIDL